MLARGYMEPNTDSGQLLSLILNIREQLALLAFSGIAGAFFRALLAPEDKWKRRITQGIGGALSAIFLGGFMAQITDQIIDTQSYSWLAWGFVMGSGGEVAVKFVQDRLMGVTGGHSSRK